MIYMMYITFLFWFIVDLNIFCGPEGLSMSDWFAAAM